jgi:hypothetical protein
MLRTVLTPALRTSNPLLDVQILLMPVAFAFPTTLLKALPNAQEHLSAPLQMMPSPMA